MPTCLPDRVATEPRWDGGAAVVAAGAACRVPPGQRWWRPAGPRWRVALTLAGLAAVLAGAGQRAGQPGCLAGGSAGGVACGRRVGGPVGRLVGGRVSGWCGGRVRGRVSGRGPWAGRSGRVGGLVRRRGRVGGLVGGLVRGLVGRLVVGWSVGLVAWAGPWRLVGGRGPWPAGRSGGSVAGGSAGGSVPAGRSGRPVGTSLGPSVGHVGGRRVGGTSTAVRPAGRSRWSRVRRRAWRDLGRDDVDRGPPGSSRGRGVVGRRGGRRVDDQRDRAAARAIAARILSRADEAGSRRRGWSGRGLAAAGDTRTPGGGWAGPAASRARRPRRRSPSSR